MIFNKCIANFWFSGNTMLVRKLKLRIIKVEEFAINNSSPIYDYRRQKRLILVQTIIYCSIAFWNAFPNQPGISYNALRGEETMKI